MPVVGQRTLGQTASQRGCHGVQPRLGAAPAAWADISVALSKGANLKWVARYFHQGEKAGVTDDWFTVAALVSAGHW